MSVSMTRYNIIFLIHNNPTMDKELYIEHTCVSQDQSFRKNCGTLTQLFLLIFIIAIYLVGIRFSLLLNDLVRNTNIGYKLYI